MILSLKMCSITFVPSVCKKPEEPSPAFADEEEWYEEFDEECAWDEEEGW